jgi:hypothetical protein
VIGVNLIVKMRAGKAPKTTIMMAITMMRMRLIMITRAEHIMNIATLEVLVKTQMSVIKKTMMMKKMIKSLMQHEKMS